MNLIQLIQKGKLVKELEQLQERRKIVLEERGKYKLFPHCSYEAKSNYGRHNKSIELLSDAIARLWLRTISYDEFDDILYKNYEFENAREYFNTLGKYFINLSSDIEEVNNLNDELKWLDERETELKDKLGIK